MPEAKAILVHLIDNVEVGYTFAKTRQTWPLHVTVVPWFNFAEGRREETVAAMQDYLQKQKAFEVQVGSEMGFGEHGEIPVNDIVPPTNFKQLHRGMIDVLGQYGGQVDETKRIWHGDEYHPHITQHDDPVTKQVEGSTRQVATIALVSLMEPKLCCVDHIFELGQA